MRCGWIIARANADVARIAKTKEKGPAFLQALFS